MDIDALALRLAQHTATDAELEGKITHAAVAAIFRPSAVSGGFDLLFIQRAEYEGDPWSGHMAFPGGRVDPEDAGPEATVAREVSEEVGIDLHASGRLLGRLSQVASPPMRSRVVVTPFVWVLRGDEPLELDAREVHSAHWFSLDRWLSDEGRGTFDYRFRGRSIPLPRVDLDGHRIWGMTLRVVDDLIDQIRTAD